MYVGYYSTSQIEAKITELDSAITAVLAGQTYSVDTGQGRISYTRASLGELRKERDRWLAEWAELTGENPGIISIEATR